MKRFLQLFLGCELLGTAIGLGGGLLAHDVQAGLGAGILGGGCLALILTVFSLL